MNLPICRLIHPTWAIATALLLVACAVPTPPPAGTQPVLDDPVRAPAEGERAGLQVYPLRNPAVTELTDAARAAEARGDIAHAAGLLERALRIQPRDPELLQHLAEVHLLRQDWTQAESFADRSFELGPRVGELCQRNWRTIALARERQNRTDQAAAARQRVADCRIVPPQRF